MNNAALEAAQRENDALCDAPEPKALSTYDLAVKVLPDQFYADQSDYLMCEVEEQATALWASIRRAIHAEDCRLQQVYESHLIDIGRVIVNNARVTLNELHGEDRL